MTNLPEGQWPTFTSGVTIWRHLGLHRDVLPGCWSPVLNPVGLWQQCQNQREEGSGLALSCQTTEILGGQEGPARDTSGALQPQRAVVASGLVGHTGEERAGAVPAALRMLGGIWAWATEHISEMF